MDNPTQIQDLIERKVTRGSFYDKIEGDIDLIVPKNLQNRIEGLRIYLTNLEYKSGRIHSSDPREKRRLCYFLHDENYGLIKAALVNEDDVERI